MPRSPAHRSRCSVRGPRCRGQPAGGSVRIEGDAEVAQKFRDLRSRAPDIEEELSRLIGDVAAHQLRQARGFLVWGRKATGAFANNVAEYLQEEGRDVPVRLEIEEFLESVDELRESADRLEARIARLESQRR
jgi:ubiquinone biosynthesis protein UbiJ